MIRLRISLSTPQWMPNVLNGSYQTLYHQSQQWHLLSLLLARTPSTTIVVGVSVSISNHTVLVILVKRPPCLQLCLHWSFYVLLSPFEVVDTLPFLSCVVAGLVFFQATIQSVDVTFFFSFRSFVGPRH